MATRDSGKVRQRIGPAVRVAREDRGLSLVTVADSAYISPSHLSRIERGLTTPGYDVLGRVADAIGVDIGTLTAEERSTREIDAILDRIPLSARARTDLLRLAPTTRAELARFLTDEGSSG